MSSTSKICRICSGFFHKGLSRSKQDSSVCYDCMKMKLFCENNSFNKEGFIIKTKLPYGIEVETYGYTALSSQEKTDTGFIETSDGSISGREYVSCVLKGDEAVDRLYSLLHPVKQRTADYRTGLHVHFGIMHLINTSKDIQNLYKSLLYLQTFFFELVPAYRFNKSSWCKRLDSSVADSFIKISNLLYNKRRLRLSRKDICGKTGSRYYWANFASLLAKGTLEIRLHSGTCNPDKIINWINLCGCFIEYCLKTDYQEVTKIKNMDDFFSKIKEICGEDTFLFYKKRHEAVKNINKISNSSGFLPRTSGYDGDQVDEPSEVKVWNEKII